MDGKLRISDYNTIIWDWNGTLLNDVWLCVEIVNKLLVNHNNLQLDEDSYRAVFGFPIIDYYKRIGIDLKKESFEILTPKFISSYEASVKKCQLHEGVMKVLNTFKENGTNQFILTAAYKESVLQLLKHYSIEDYFIEIEGLDNYRAESKVDRGKQLISANNINKETTVLIGDTIHDFEVAQEIEVDCILIANGHQSRKRLKDSTQGKVKILDKIGELIA